MGLSPLVVSMGEPAGIGGDITLMAWDKERTRLPAFAALDDPGRLTSLAARLGLDVPIRVIDHPSQAPDLFRHALPVLPIPLTAPVQPGCPDPANAKAVTQAIATGVAMAKDGRARALVTNPIHKGVLYQAGFAFPGHTEYLAHLLGQSGTEVMMLACPDLKVVPVTIHVGLAQAIRDLSGDLIVRCGETLAASLRRDFAIADPVIAVAGLNPHAGEDGAMGTEDQTIVGPAVARLQALGIRAKGPLPSDTMFHPAARQGYDAALCMYHDQALIPLKTLGFDKGVNVTLGLPMVRTSPDHGTAFDLAGSGRADPGSLIQALLMADQIARNRQDRI